MSVSMASDPFHRRALTDRVLKVAGSVREFPDGATYGNNRVITSSYTWWNFLPKNLFEQFHNLANIYFLFVGVLQMIPSISTTAGLPSMYVPLGFIIAVSALRAAFEDKGKHDADEQRNGYEYLALTSDGFKPTPAGELEVGTVVKIQKDEMIPADLLFIGSSLSKGHCFIDKANLNGETTLEVLQSIKQLKPVVRDDEALQNLHIHLVYEQANKRFDKFRGMMYIGDDLQGAEGFPVDGKSLVMRETNLRNNDYIYGLVVYTGDDTKIQRSNNSGDKPRLKKTKMMHRVDRFLMGMLLFQFLLCVLNAALAAGWVARHDKDWYFRFSDADIAATFFIRIFTWFILLSQMVPISLVVTAEMVKFTMSLFMQWDLHMYHEPIDKAAKCNSSTIHEDLGAVDYIFSDKTGTLTQNRMEFRYALLPHTDFGSQMTDIAKAVEARNREMEMHEEAAQEQAEYQPLPATPWTELAAPLTTGTHDTDRTPSCCEKRVPCWGYPPQQHDQDKAHENGVELNEFTDEERQVLLRALWGKCPDNCDKAKYEEERERVRGYVTHMALSNTVKPYEDPDTKEARFQSESAEEQAMVLWAKSVGFEKVELAPTVLEITEYDHDLIPTGKVIREQYNFLGTLGFTSQRARVTVVYQLVKRSFLDAKTKDVLSEDDDKTIGREVKLMMKGQDTVVLPLLRDSGEAKDQLMLDLNGLCANGLRTLVCAEATLPLSWWTESRAAAYQEVVSRDETDASRGHPSECEKAPECTKCAQHAFFEALERDAGMMYVGCMGLEDQLQLLVPHTIRDFLQAGIKVWMITGDKLETAKNIGLACNLIDPDMLPRFRPGASLEDCVQQFNEGRLLEITGQWARVQTDREELGRLFDVVDIDRNGLLGFEDLSYCLDSLHSTAMDGVKLHEMMEELHPGSAVTGITKEQFIGLMQSTTLTLQDAVDYDLKQAIERYKRIEDHVKYPCSLLVNRAAFHVLFPDPLTTKREDQGRRSGADSHDAGHVWTEEKLERLRDRFFWLASVCKSVLFARAEPAMKKRMVTEVMRRVPTAVALAVGDGANDTDMITAAHVGVGIAGVEGTAATNSADYAIGTFRMLHTLILVHGYWSYQRMTTLVYIIFYKASLLALTGYFFGFYSGFSGQQFYNDLIYLLYNVMFTAFPVMALAVWDRRLPRDTLENNPQAFREARGVTFSSAGFAGWVFRAAFHGAISFFIPIMSLAGHNDVVNSNGQTVGFHFIGIVVYNCIVLTPSFIVMFEMTTINLLAAATVAFSVVSYYICEWFLSNWLALNGVLFGVVTRIHGSGAAWLTMLLTVAIPLLCELAFRHCRLQFSPEFDDVMRERLTQKRKVIRKEYFDSKLNLEEGSKQHLEDHQQGGGDEQQEMKEMKKKSSSARVGSRRLLSRDTHKELPRASKLIQASHTMSRRKLSQPHHSDHRLFESPKASVVRDPSKDHMRQVMVRSMLRWRNLTGAAFDSAAQAKFQDHDDAKIFAKSRSPTPGVGVVNGVSRINNHKLPSKPVTWVEEEKQENNARMGVQRSSASSSIQNVVPATSLLRAPGAATPAAAVTVNVLRAEEDAMDGAFPSDEDDDAPGEDLFATISPYKPRRGQQQQHSLDDRVAGSSSSSSDVMHI